MSRTLKQWEAYLVGAMPRVQLLSELGLNIEDKEKIKDSLTKRLSLNVKTGVLDVNDVTVVETKKVDDSHLYKV